MKFALSKNHWWHSETVIDARLIKWRLRKMSKILDRINTLSEE